jgi:hypothetical protein
LSLSPLCLDALSRRMFSPHNKIAPACHAYLKYLCDIRVSQVSLWYTRISRNFKTAFRTAFRNRFSNWAVALDGSGSFTEGSRSIKSNSPALRCAAGGSARWSFLIRNARISSNFMKYVYVKYLYVSQETLRLVRISRYTTISKYLYYINNSTSYTQPSATTPAAKWYFTLFFFLSSRRAFQQKWRINIDNF